MRYFISTCILVLWCFTYKAQNKPYAKPLTRILFVFDASNSMKSKYNQITRIPSLEGHKYLRVLKLVGNKITNITGLEKNKKL